MTEHYSTDIPLSDINIFTLTPLIRNRRYKLKTCSGVFSYKKIDKGTLLLLRHLQIPDDATQVLDMGTGYGVIGIVVATEFPHIKVTMVDINRRAVWIARENVKLNNLSNVQVYWGNFFEPIKNTQFDVILSNPPLALGHTEIFQFISNTPPYLNNGGSLFLVVRTKQGAKKIAAHMHSVFGNATLLKIQGGYRLFQSQKTTKQKL